jgi:hypothetical protein
LVDYLKIYMKKRKITLILSIGLKGLWYNIRIINNYKVSFIYFSARIYFKIIRTNCDAGT